MIGSGVGKRLSEVRWAMAGRMAIAWLLTLPAAALAGAVAGRVAAIGDIGVVIVAVLAVAAAGTIYRLSRRDAVTAHNVNATA